MKRVMIVCTDGSVINIPGAFIAFADGFLEAWSNEDTMVAAVKRDMVQSVHLSEK